MHIEVAAARHIRRNHVEGAVVIADSGGEDTSRGSPVSKGKLTLLREDMPDLAPVHKVLTMEQRHAGEILERAGHQEIILPNAANTGVRVEAGNDRIGESHYFLRRLAVVGVGTRRRPYADDYAGDLPQ